MQSPPLGRPTRPMGKRGVADGNRIHIDWIALFRDGFPEPPETELSPPAVPAAREVAVVEIKPCKKIWHSLGSNDSDSSGRQVWADVTDTLLHLIIALLTSFHDFLAVTSTCSSWRATVSSFPPTWHLSFPPLCVKTGLHYARRHIGDEDYSHNSLSNKKWQLHDPARTNLSVRCSAPRHTPYYVRYLGCSYGYFIFHCEEQSFLVDVYTSTMVKPPKLRRSDNSKIYYGTFTAPLSSPNSCLLLFSRKYMFQWQVGAKSWTEHSLVSNYIHQMVSFKGQIFAMDFFYKLNTVSLVPQLGMREVPVVWGAESMVPGVLQKQWLVACGDMLLMVDLSIDIRNLWFQAYRLDLSVEPAKLLKLDKLENWALFVSFDRRSSTFSCMNPERWGGKSNCIYVPSRSKNSSKPWIEVELGQFVPKSHPSSYILGSKSKQLESFWVLPSLVYGVSE